MSFSTIRLSPMRVTPPTEINHKGPCEVKNLSKTVRNIYNAFDLPSQLKILNLNFQGPK